MGSIARWLWMTHDRIDGDELPFTQAYLAVTLGVRRAGVTVAPETLETDDLIAGAAASSSYPIANVLRKPRVRRTEYLRKSSDARCR